MKTAALCCKCGEPLTRDARGGICPRCLFNLVGAGTSDLHPDALSPTRLQSGPDFGNTATTWTGKYPADLVQEPILHSFGDYELLEEIARGGMGVVYKARQKSLGRLVAVKLILAGQFAGKQIAQRFKSEAIAAAVLQHPNIVAVHEVGVHQGHHFFSMDHVEGKNLADLVGQRPLGPRESARYLKLIAKALHYAHRQGILHRDLKPSNVLIETATDQPRVTDFGLAKRLHEESSLTLTGELLGSPHFMPPEQASAGRGKVGRTSDVFGLGGILYFLLTARVPFQGETIETTIEQVLHVQPVSPRLLNPALPRDLETICLKCLEKSPARRYQTAQELADDLGRFMRDEPILARPVSHFEKAWRWCRRKPLVAGLSATTLALLLSIAVASPIALYHINQQRDGLDGQRQELAERNLALQAAHEHARVLNERARQAIEAVSSETAIEQLTREKDLRPEQKDFLDKMIQYYAESAQEAAATEQERSRQARTYHQMGRMNQILGRFQDSENAYRRAVALGQRLAADFPNRPEFRQELAMSHNRLGVLLLRTASRSAEAESAYMDALTILKQLAADFPNRPEFRQALAGIQSNLGNLLLEAGRLAEAESAQTEALAIRKQLAANSPTDRTLRRALAMSHNNFGWLLHSTGRLKEAESAFRDASTLQKQVAADFPNRPEFRMELAKDLNNLGNVLHDTGRLKEAGDARAEALVIYKQLVADFPNRPEFRQELADAEGQTSPSATQTQGQGGRGVADEAE